MWCSFPEVAELVSGQDFPPEKYNSTGEGIPYIIGASNIADGHLRISRWTEYPSVLSTKGDILVVCKGSGVGKVAVNDLGSVHIARQIQAVRIQNETISSDFMHIIIDWCVPSIVSHANGLIPGLKRELLLNALLPVPPRREQDRIVSILNCTDAIIKGLEAEQTELDNYSRKSREKVLDLAIHGKLVSQDPSDEPAIELLKRINPSFSPSDNLHYEGVVPKGWLVLTYNDVANYINGRAFKPEEWESEGIPIIRIQNLNEPCAPYNYSNGSFEKQYHVKKGDLLFSWAASLGVYIWKEQDAWLNQHIFKVIPFSCIDKEYLYFALSASINDFYQKCHGSGMVHITRKQFINMPLLLPPMNEQKRIIKAIKAYFDTLEKIVAVLN